VWIAPRSLTSTASKHEYSMVSQLKVIWPWNDQANANIGQSQRVSTHNDPLYSFHCGLHVKWSSVGHFRVVYSIIFETFCFSAIRFRGDVILQVSCYTLFKWIPTSVATILRSVSHGTPFRVYRKIGADIVKPSLSWERQVESLIASSAYQKWPTTNPRCTND